MAKQGNQTIELRSGAQVKVLSIGKTTFKGSHPILQGPYVLIKLQLLKNENAKVSGARIADEFFSQFAIKLHQVEEKKALINLVIDRKTVPLLYSFVKGARERSEFFSYQRVATDLWIPEGRKIPEWLKVRKPQNVQLSDGTNLWFERRDSAKLGFSEKFIPIIELRTDQKIKGSKPAYHLIQRYAEEKLIELRNNNKYIVVVLYLMPAKDGIHLRPNVKSVILHKNDREFWMASSISKIFFQGDNSFGFMLSYLPTADFGNTKKLKLVARQIQQLHGKYIAERFNVKTSAIIAQAASENFGMQVQKYGVVFYKDRNGIWSEGSK